MAKATLTAAEVEARKRAIKAGATVARVTTGGFVRDMRLAADLSQTELAKQAGGQLAQTKVSQIEIGTFNGDAKAVELALKFLADLKENKKNAKITATKARYMAALYFAGGKMEKI